MFHWFVSFFFLLNLFPLTLAQDRGNGLSDEDLKFLKQAEIKIIAPTWIPDAFRLDRVKIKYIERINIQYAIRWVRYWDNGFKQQYINLVCTKRKLQARDFTSFKDIETDVWGKIKLYTYGNELELDTSTLTTLNSIKDTGLYYVLSSQGMQYRPRITVLEMERVVKSMRVM